MINSEPNKEPEPPRSESPRGPIVVFRQRDRYGTHRFNKRFLDARENETIKIEAGSYPGLLTFDRSVRLVGTGKFRIQQATKACIAIRGDSQIQFENLIVECQADNTKCDRSIGREADYERMRSLCHLSRESYDCVRVAANAVFEAEDCLFQTTEHAAISVEKDAKISIRNSRFTSPPYAFVKKRAGSRERRPRGPSTTAAL